jgi:ribosomal protein S12 methylthiotransferase accessory factor
VVAATGSDVVVVDQTTPDQVLPGLRTVRVLAPGLPPIDFGWRRQRALHLPRSGPPTCRPDCVAPL